MTTLTLPDPKPNWVFIMDLQFPVNMLQKIWIIDGDARKLLGTVFGGYEANFEISPDHREMYMIDTYYSRGWRGDRTDVVSIFDAHTTNLHWRDRDSAQAPAHRAQAQYHFDHARR